MEPRYNEGPKDWQNLFAITRSLHIFYYYWGKEKRSLYRGFRYIEVRYTEVFVVWRFVISRFSLYRGSLYRGFRYIEVDVISRFRYIEVRYTEVFVI